MKIEELLQRAVEALDEQWQDQEQIGEDFGQFRRLLHGADRTEDPGQRAAEDVAEGAGAGGGKERPARTSAVPEPLARHAPREPAAAGRGMPDDPIPGRGLRFEDSTAGFFTVLLATRDVVSDEQTLRLHGLNPGAEPTLENLLSTVPPDSLNEVMRQLERLWAQVGDYVIEYPVRWPDGSPHLLQQRVRVVADDSGRPLRVMGVVGEAAALTDVDHSEVLDRLHEFLDHEMSDDDSEKVRRHLERCSSCREEYLLEGMVREVVRRAAGHDAAPDEVREKILARIRRIQSTLADLQSSI